MTQLPDYVEYGGRVTAPPPFLFTGGTFRGYLLEGNAQKIADLVERVYNVPAQGKVVYRPLFGKWLLMQTGAFTKCSSQVKGFEDWGYIEEASISLWVPVAAGRIENGEFVALRICMAVPYVLVDNPMSYVGGREIYGYQKSLGKFEPRSAVGDPQRVEAFGGDFVPNTAADWHPLFELRRTGGAAQPAGGSAHGRPTFALADALEALRPVWQELDPNLPELRVLEDILEALTGKQTRQVFLKQFRDVQIAGAACYRAVVESAIELISSKVRPSLDEWEIVVHHLDSHPVDVELGVTTQSTRLSFEVEMDFVAAGGEVVA
jgi:PII-like signaling protein